MRLLRSYYCRRSLFNVILFLLGAGSCLLCLQLIQLSDNNGSSDSNFLGIINSKSNLESSFPVVGASYYEEVFSEHVEKRERNLPEVGTGDILDDNFKKTNKLRSNRSNNKRAAATIINDLAIDDNGGGGDSNGNLIDNITASPIVYVVTPTFYRPEQKPELLRLAQALLPVSYFIHWIVVDDISQGSERSLDDLKRFLEKFPITFTLLKSLPPSDKMKIVGRPRGVGGRRAAIAWLRKNIREGVVYFADDDNAYNSDIFLQMQHTKKVSMWPVGLVTDYGVSSPIVHNGKVIGFYDGWNGFRKFPVDMAGFAINMELFLKKPHANMPWVAGYEEDELLKTLGVTINDIEPLANNCTQILVWHTKTVRNPWPKKPKTLKPQTEIKTNLKHLLLHLPQKSLAGPKSSTTKTEEFSFIKFFFGGS